MFTTIRLLSKLNVPYHLYTLFLFTRSDLITALVPQTFLALSIAPVCHPSHIFHVVAWIWLHILICTIANQVNAPDEDKSNKPFRPLPSGRISESNALILRWALVPVCLLVSAAYGTSVLYTSVVLQLFNVLYNDLRGGEHCVLKSLLPAVLYGCAGFAGALLAGCDRSHASVRIQLGVTLSTAVIGSTIHAQDFRDVSGDRLMGRITLPMVFPLGSRVSLALGIPLWAICLCRVYQLDPLTASAFVLYSGYTGMRFLIYTSEKEDDLSCNFHSIWLALNHILPAYWHICMAISASCPSTFSFPAWFVRDMITSNSV